LWQYLILAGVSEDFTPTKEPLCAGIGTGQAKQMEGNGVHHITKELFDEGFEIIGVCHDSDACTFDEVIQFFLK